MTTPPAADRPAGPGPVSTTHQRNTTPEGTMTSSITITHTHENGTLVEGTARGDGTNTILKGQGFRWFRTLGQWGIPSSRDRQPNEWKIGRAADALRAAGHDVDVEIDRSHRDTATVEADKATRAAARADALAAKADRKHAAADAAEAAQRRAVDMLPPDGEPIKIGHHSENRHRRAIEKAHTALGKSVQADRDAAAADQRAAIAAVATDRRNNPVTVANRINKLEAEQRADQRTLDGHSRVVADLGERGKIVDASPAATGEYRDRVIDRMAERADQIAYWKQVRDQQIANGQATNYGPDTINKGDAVKTWHGWSRAIRVNKKTVSVDVTRYYQAATRIITDTVLYHEIRDHKPATETRDLDATG